jgi:transporter family-2 protein
MYRALAPLVGILITLMNGLNSRFSAITGSLIASLSIHVAGLCVVSLFLLVKREKREAGRLPFYYYLGGFIGVGTVFSSNYAFTALDASLAVALALLGQTLFSVAVDASGFLGRKKQAFTWRSFPGIILAAMGALIIARNWRAAAPGMLAALVAGALPSLSFVLNAELGRKRGILHSTRTNYLAGLATTLLIVALTRPNPATAWGTLVAAGPFLSLGGGTMGVVVVSSMNFVFARMPAFSATLLVFSGQALAGLLIDAVSQGFFDLRKMVGICVLLAGLAVNTLLSKRKQNLPTVDSSGRGAAMPNGKRF